LSSLEKKKKKVESLLDNKSKYEDVVSLGDGRMKERCSWRRDKETRHFSQ